MVQAYSLYFDSVRVDWDRRARRATAVLIVAAHLALIGWLLLTRPPVPASAPAMVMVELNALANATAALDHRRHGDQDTTKATVSSARPKAASRDHGSQTSIDHASRPSVREGRLTAGNETQDASAVATAAGTGISGAAAVAGESLGGTGAGSAGHFVPPRVLSHWLPRYPYEAWAKHVEGDVDVIVTISSGGDLLDAHVDRSSGNASLDAAALEAVRHYRFRPATKAGEPVEAQAIVAVEWRITPGIKIDMNFTMPGDPRDQDVHRNQNKMDAAHLLQSSPDAHIKD